VHARDDQLAVGLDDQTVGRLIDAAQVGGHLPGCAEAGIQTAVVVVARQRQLHLAADKRGANRHDLTVGLQHGIMDVVQLAEIRRNDAGRMERRIERAVGVVAHQGKVEVAAARGCVARGYNLVVSGISTGIGIGHDQDGVGPGVKIAQLGGDDAARAEGRIEAAVGVVADEREVRGAAEGAGLHRAGDDDLAVGRDGHAGGRGIAARVGEHAARVKGLGRLRSRLLHRVAKGAVQAAVGVIAGQGKLLAAARPGKAGDKDLAVGLDGQPAGHAVGARAQAGGDFARRAEARIERAVAVEACQGELRAIAAGLPGHHDPAIGLHGQRLDLGRAQAEVGRGLAAGKDDIQIAGTEQQAVFEILKRSFSKRASHGCTSR
jgi:hypothetical protein